jgi:hypothetical protein
LVDVMLGVSVVGRLKLSSALKSSVIGVPPGNNWLNWLEYFETLASGQLSVCRVLKTSKKLVLLWCFDVVNDVN